MSKLPTSLGLFGALGIALLFGCNGDKYSNKDLRELLFEKYQTEFEVYNHWYHFELGHYVFTARSREDRSVVAYGTYGAKGRPIHDNYPQTLFSRQAQEQGYEILDRFYERVLVLPNVNSHYEHKSGATVVDLTSVLASPNLHLRSSYRIFVFDSFNENDLQSRERMLRGILALIRVLNRNPGLEYDLWVEFWDTGLSDTEFAEIRRDFDPVGDSVLRNPERKAGRALRIMRIEFQSSPDLKISADALFAAMEPAAKGLRAKKTRF